MSNSILHIACEGPSDESVLLKIANDAGWGSTVTNVYVQYGSKNLIKNLQRYNEAAQNNPDVIWLAVLDLDQNLCPVDYAHECLKEPAQGMLFRIAVREVEAWLMADREMFSKFFHVPIGKVPHQPDELSDPKQTLFNLVRRYSPKALKEDVLPVGTAKCGRGYLIRIQEFTTGSPTTAWRTHIAMQCSDSLRRCFLRLHNKKLLKTI